MRIAIAMMTALSTGYAFATLPPPTEAAAAQAAEAKAKSAWSDKVALYQLCLAQDRTVEAYRRSGKTNSAPAGAAMPVAPCANPGPYVSQITPVTSKPLEASGAHSPPGTATSPPSTNATAAEIARKKN